MQVSEGKSGQYNLILGKLDESKEEGEERQGWRYGRDWPLDPTHSVQVLIDIQCCHFISNDCQVEGEPLEDCLEAARSLPSPLHGNISYLQVLITYY